MSAVADAAKWIRVERGKLGWSNAILAERVRALMKDEGLDMRFAQQTLSAFENGTAKRMPSWFRFVQQAIAAEHAVHPSEVATARDLRLQFVQMTVALPSARALSRMFEGLLAPLDLTAPKAELAELLAQRLPIGLSQVQGPLIEHDPDEDPVPGEAPPPPSPAPRASSPARRT